VRHVEHDTRHRRAQRIEDCVERIIAEVIDAVERRRRRKQAQVIGTLREQPVAAPALQPVYAPVGDDPIVKMSPMQSAISRSMAQSMATAAQTTLASEMEVSGLVATYRSIKERYTAAGVKLSYTAMIIKAVAHALENHPDARTMTVDGKTCWTMSHMNIGVAVDVPNGLIVPVIRGADEKNVLGLQRAIVDLATRARARQLKPDEVQGGTFSITNFGSFGSLVWTPIINQPQVAIMGVGTVDKTAVVVDDAIAIRSICHLSLSFDHRLIDGALADQFMTKVKHVLENWSEEVL
jgi:pyruvate/2-oxoglutarate dehydrogenase complex dihydrolipoamide acyltransferase (E2) component